MEIVLVGLNHRTAPVEVRERVSFTAEQARRAADELRARGMDVAAAHRHPWRQAAVVWLLSGRLKAGGML